MPTTEQISNTKVSPNFIDVLYLTNNNQIPFEIKQLLRQKKLSFSILPLDKFSHILQQIKLIGTVVIDTKGISDSQQQKLPEITESFVTKNIGTIVLGSVNINLSLKNFIAGQLIKRFSLINIMESVSIEGLWATISVNLAYRRKTVRLSEKIKVLQKKPDITNTCDLAEQLRTAETVAGNLAEQLRMAGYVQRDFLPKHLPNSEQIRWSATFLPCECASGDIYDIARIDEQHIGFYIADVVGHGMPAALLTIFIKQSLVMREIIGNNYRIFPAAEVIRNLNLRMTEKRLSGQQFATCCYCILNIKTLQLTYARAGHPYPVLIRGSNPPQHLETRGSLLGVFERANYVQQTIQLQPGDKLLLYSDGAEPFIGGYSEENHFTFNEYFHEIKDLGIDEMTEKLSTIFQNSQFQASSIDDDITTIGLEIL